MAATEQTYHSALVLGLGESGRAAAGLLLSEGTAVTVVDAGDNGFLRSRADALRNEGATVLLGCGDIPGPAAGQEDFDICILSPGIPLDSPWIDRVRSRRVGILPEIELGISRCRCPVLAVTGSNGKSTMVKFCADAMNQGGLHAAAAGNYGLPVCEVARQGDCPDWLVLEVSSFQLESVADLRPRVAVLLNIQPDHLDRHGDMDTYLRMKMRLFERMNSDESKILHDQVAHEADTLLSENGWITFGLSAECDFTYADGTVRFEEGIVDLHGTLFDNEIMGQTAAAAVAALRACGVGAETVERAARQFEPLPHRMQEVGSIDGVRFVNDSKATNLAALGAALTMSEEGVRLIAGGLLKEKELESTKELLVKKVKRVYLIGDAASVMKEAWGGAVDCCLCGDLGHAVEHARADAARNETVLLSPGCASFDQFDNFEDRGNQFTTIVRSIDEER